MARYKGPVCRLCRREGEKLFLKGERCFKDKCSVERRSYAPGQHGQRRSKVSDYGVQLREKQKVRRIYGVLEKQFRAYFFQADRKKGVTGENLLRILESRLDNVVYRLCFADSRAESRHFIRHGHFNLNGKKVNIPSLQVRPGDVISIAVKSSKVERIKTCFAAVDRRGVPQWIEADKKELKGVIHHLPTREEIPLPVREQLIVELYSK